MAGKITGAGPTNDRKRKALMATGWRPYSVKIGDYYVSYARLDPHSTAVGLAADTVEYSTDLFTDPQTRGEPIKAAVLVGQLAFAQNVANKSYLAGLTDFLNALTQPDKKAKYFMQQRLASYEPKFVQQFTPWTDEPYMRRAHSYLDALKARTPGLADSVEPYRNVFGEPMLSMHPTTAWAAPMNPFLISKDENDEVLHWLNSLDYGFSAPTPQIMGVSWLDMRRFKDPKTGQSAYDFFQKAVGEITIQGLTLRETLEKLMEQDEMLMANHMVNEWDDNALLQSVFKHDDERVKEVKRIIAEYREAAAVVTWKSGNAKFPKLTKAYMAYVIARDNVEYLVASGQKVDVLNLTGKPPSALFTKPMRKNLDIEKLFRTKVDYEGI